MDTGSSSSYIVQKPWSPVSPPRKGSGSGYGIARIPTAKCCDPVLPLHEHASTSHSSLRSQVNDSEGVRSSVSNEYWPGTDSEDSDIGRAGRELKRQNTKSTSKTTGFFRSLAKKLGRTFNKRYDLFPNDQKERDRNLAQHEIVLHVFDGKLHLAPLTHPRRVLDVGTGPGIWALWHIANQKPEAKSNPSCTVVGVDVEPVRPPYTVSNCEFRTLDVREEWDFQEEFDFIHVRTLGQFPSDMFRKMLDTIYQNLAPGGWVEFTEWIMHLQSGDRSTDGTAFHSWNHNLRRGLHAINRSASYATRYAPKLEDAGFTNVTQRKFSIPINPWPPGEKLQHLGEMMSINVQGVVDPITVPIFLGILGWTEEAVQALLGQVFKDIVDTNLHAFMPL
ncbi:putative Tam domain methyltransferase [Seiridium cardinale]